jgi:hypothetical protein
MHITPVDQESQRGRGNGVMSRILGEMSGRGTKLQCGGVVVVGRESKGEAELAHANFGLVQFNARKSGKCR